MTRQYDPSLLAEPRTLAVRFSPKGRVTGHGWSFQCAPANSGIAVWTIGPLEWWHGFGVVPPETSFDDAVRSTGLPRFLGWDT